MLHRNLVHLAAVADKVNPVPPPVSCHVAVDVLSSYNRTLACMRGMVSSDVLLHNLL